MAAAKGAKFAGFNSINNKLSLLMSLKRRIWAVMVVPIFAPIMTLMAFRSFNTRALTKPTTITVVAEEDCIAAVTKAPNATPLKTLLVTFSSVCSNRPPDTFSKLPPKRDIPYRNKANPPNSLITPKISKLLPHFAFPGGNRLFSTFHYTGI